MEVVVRGLYVMHVRNSRTSRDFRGVFEDGFRGLCQQTIPPLHNPSVLPQARSQYRFEVTTVAGFVQQLAVSYVQRGYWFYVAGEIPAGKDVSAVDRKLIERYGVGVSKWTRARRKAAGYGAVHYLRYERFFVLIACTGKHQFFELEPKFRDIRRTPLKFAGHSIGCRVGRDGRYHPSVRVERREYAALKRYFLRSATSRPAEAIAEELNAAPYLHFAHVRRQILGVALAVNRARRAAGLDAVPLHTLRLRRKPVKVFRDVVEER